MSSKGRIYRGVRVGGPHAMHPVVWVLNESGQPEALCLRLDLVNHSPTGPEWGYLGSGPAQLAIALLADATGSDAYAMAMGQWFKRDIVAQIPRERWELTQHEVLEWANNNKVPIPR